MQAGKWSGGRCCRMAVLHGVGWAVVATVLVLQAPACALVHQGQDLAGTAPLTAFGLGARAAGMGGAFVAVADDAAAVHFNAAGLSRVQGHRFTSLYQRQLGAMSVFALGYAQRGWGLSYSGYTLGDLAYRDDYGVETDGAFGVSESLATAGFGLRVWGIDVGVVAKHYAQRVELASGSGWAADAGLLWAPARWPVSIGVVARNLVGRVRFEAGTADPFDPVWVAGSAVRLGAVTVVLDKQTPGPWRTGLEWRASPQVALRAGAHGGEPSGMGPVTLTGGVGLRFAGFSVGYAYEQPPVLDGTHRLALEVSI